MSTSLDDKATPKGTMTLREALNSKDLLVIDVRSEEEYSSGHSSCAKNIPIDVFESRISELGTDLHRPIVIHCARGMRAATCADVAVNRGFVNAFRQTNAAQVDRLLSECKEKN